MSASTPSIAPAAVLYTAGQPDLNNARNEVAFVLDNVADWKTLADGMRAGVEVVVLDSRGDGLAQMADWLAKKTPGSVDAIHLLSHGSSGAINLGALTLKSTNLNDHADTLAQIGSALTQDGDWLMYGCNVAAGAAGVDLIGQLVQASGADVAASTDLTGAATAGGDWVLEYAAGSIDAATMPVSQYDQLLVDASFNFDSGVSGNTTATMTMTVSGETLNIVITQDNLYLTSYAGESPINGSDSVLTGNNNATKITFSLAGGKQFGLSSLKIREVFGASESLTLRTNNGSTAAYSLTPYEAYT